MKRLSEPSYLEAMRRRREVNAEIRAQIRVFEQWLREAIWGPLMSRVQELEYAGDYYWQLERKLGVRH